VGVSIDNRSSKYFKPRAVNRCPKNDSSPALAVRLSLKKNDKSATSASMIFILYNVSTCTFPDDANENNIFHANILDIRTFSLNAATPADRKLKECWTLEIWVRESTKKNIYTDMPSFKITLFHISNQSTRTTYWYLYLMEVACDCTGICWRFAGFFVFFLRPRDMGLAGGVLQA
jgi:hypothetical protein